MYARYQNAEQLTDSLSDTGVVDAVGISNHLHRLSAAGLFGVAVYVLDETWSAIALHLNYKENHRLGSDYDAALAVKLFIFQYFNQYAYVANVVSYKTSALPSVQLLFLVNHMTSLPVRPLLRRIVLSLSLRSQESTLCRAEHHTSSWMVCGWTLCLLVIYPDSHEQLCTVFTPISHLRLAPINLARYTMP